MASYSGRWTASGNYVASSNWGGTGTAANPYTIKSAAELATLAHNVTISGEPYSGKYFKLTADIDLDGHYWVPIGINSDTPFEGYIDGGGHKISNMSISYNHDTSINTNKMPSSGFIGYATGQTADYVLKNVYFYNVQSLSSSYSLYFGTAAGYLLNTKGIYGVAVRFASTSITLQNTSYQTYTMTNNVGGLVGEVRVTSSSINCEISDCVVYAGVIKASMVYGDSTAKVGVNFRVSGLVGSVFKSAGSLYIKKCSTYIYRLWSYHDHDISYAYHNPACFSGLLGWSLQNTISSYCPTMISDCATCIKYIQTTTYGETATTMHSYLAWLGGYSYTEAERCICNGVSDMSWVFYKSTGDEVDVSSSTKIKIDYSGTVGNYSSGSTSLTDIYFNTTGGTTTTSARATYYKGTTACTDTTKKNYNGSSTCYQDTDLAHTLNNSITNHGLQEGWGYCSLMGGIVYISDGIKLMGTYYPTFRVGIIDENGVGYSGITSYTTRNNQYVRPKQSTLNTGKNLYGHVCYVTNDYISGDTITTSMVDAEFAEFVADGSRTIGGYGDTRDWIFNIYSLKGNSPFNYRKDSSTTVEIDTVYYKKDSSTLVESDEQKYKNESGNII